MAVLNVNQHASDDQRTMIALEAAWEVESLADAIIREVGPEVHTLAVRGIALRVKQLSGIIMSAIDDEVASADDLGNALRGVDVVATA